MVDIFNFKHAGHTQIKRLGVGILNTIRMRQSTYHTLTNFTNCSVKV